MLGAAMVKRADAYTFMRNSVSLRVRQNFIMLLSARSYIGKMKIVHTKEELHLSVSAVL